MIRLIEEYLIANKIFQFVLSKTWWFFVPLGFIPTVILTILGLRYGSGQGSPTEGRLPYFLLWSYVFGWFTLLFFVVLGFIVWYMWL